MMEQVLQEDVECNGDNSEDEELEGEEDIKVSLLLLTSLTVVGRGGGTQGS